MDFFILILYPSALLNSFINSNSSLVETLEFCIYHVIWNSDSLTSSLPVWILFISFSCLASVTRTSSQSVSSVTQSHLTLCNPMDCIMRGFPIHRQLPELAQTHVHRVGDAIQPSHPLSSASPPAFNLSHRISNTMSNKREHFGHLCLVPDFRGKAFSFSALSMASAVGFL